MRRWFYHRDFTEVQTPVLTLAPAPEPSIETFRIPEAAKAQGHSQRLQDLFLVPSPELFMKRLLARGMSRIFQITPVFRREELGNFHQPEFTMLEWYHAGCDYTALMADCESLLAEVSRAVGHDMKLPLPDGRICDISRPFHQITVSEAFEKYAGWLPGPEPDPDRFNIDMVEKVEPGLPADKPVFLMDYPASMASLARLKPGNPEVAERVELYAGGMELANGFSELHDPHEQRARFLADIKKQQEAGLNPTPMPEQFLQDLSSMPPAAGMALGIDRLIMLLLAKKDIREVVAFEAWS